MKINIISHVDEVSAEKISGNTAVVIDVFRATSVIVTALAHGAKEIIAAGSIEQAWDAYRLQETGTCILGGEHKMKKIPGFHYGNSPSEYITGDIKNKTVILATTNGTKAIQACSTADRVYICSFLNCATIAAQLALTNNDFVIVCSGSFKVFSLDDALCAGMLVKEMMHNNCGHIEIDDFTASLKILYESCESFESCESSGVKIKQLLANNCRAYRELFKISLQADIDFCLQQNIYPVVPLVCGGTIKI